MPDIYEQVGKQIRELRTTLRGRGISQEELAQAVKTTANTISRWETATYKPSISDLERLAQFFWRTDHDLLSPGAAEVTGERTSQCDCRPRRRRSGRGNAVRPVQKGAAQGKKKALGSGHLM